MYVCGWHMRWSRPEKHKKRAATNTDAQAIRTAERSTTKVTTTECQPQSKRQLDIDIPGNTSDGDDRHTALGYHETGIQSPPVQPLVT
jgi:hypothetical protein